MQIILILYGEYLRQARHAFHMYRVSLGDIWRLPTEAIQPNKGQWKQTEKYVCLRVRELSLDGGQQSMALLLDQLIPWPTCGVGACCVLREVRPVQQSSHHFL